MNTSAVFEIARQEFARLLIHPLVPLAALLVLIAAYLNGAGGAHDLEILSGMDLYHKSDMVLVGFGQSLQSTSMICTIMAAFLGAISIPYERWKNTVNVLLTKPLYRRDFIIGKFVGLSAFMLLFNTISILLIGLLIIVYFRGPQSDLEFAWRLMAYILVLTLSCSLVIALNMLFGTISKNLLVVTSASITYIFIDWIWYNDKFLGSLSVLTPVNLYFKLITPFPITWTTLFDTLVPFDRWFYGIIPYLAILFAEMSILLLMGIFVFSRDDNI